MMEHAPDRQHRRVDPTAEKRPHERASGVLVDLTGVDGGVDLLAEAVRRQVRAAAGVGHPVEAPGGARRRRRCPPPSALPGYAGVEVHRAVAHQVLATLGGESDGVGQHGERESEGEVGDGVEAASLDQLVHQRRGEPLELVAHLTDRLRREYSRQHAACHRVVGRIDLEDYARLLPRALTADVDDSHAECRGEP